MMTISGVSPSQEKLALRLFEIGAFRDRRASSEGKGFRLKLHEKNPDAPLSPYFVDLRTPNNPKPGRHPLSLDDVRMIGEELYLLAKVRGLLYHFVAGVPRAGDPFAEAFVEAGLRRGKYLPLLSLEKEEGGSEREIARITGNIQGAGCTALLVDDLITEAHSKLEAANVLRRAEFQVYDVLVLLDREQGGGRELVRRGYNLHTVFTISALLELYRAFKKIPEEVYEEIQDYRLRQQLSQ